MADVTWAPLSVGTVRIPLPIENISFLSPNQRRFSGYVTSALGPMDKMLTPIRYVAVKENILNNTNSPGSAIEFMNNGSTVGLILKIGTLSAVAAVAAFNVYLEYTEQEKEKAKSEKQLQDLRATLKKNGLNTEAKNIKDKDKFINNIEEYNAFLKDTLDENKELREKYQSIKLELPLNPENLSYEDLEANIRLTFVAKAEERVPSIEKSKADEIYAPLIEELEESKDDIEQPLSEVPAEKKLSAGKKIKKGLDSVINKVKPWYDAGNLISFTYWILWMSVGIMTGSHAAAGIGGLPNWAAFLGPFSLIAFPIIGIHLYNYYKHGRGEGFSVYYKNLELKKKAEEDFNLVMSEATKKSELEYWKNLNRQLSIEVKEEKRETSELDVDFKPSMFDAAVTGSVEAVYSQINFQYLSWFSSDALTVLMGVVIGASAATPIGWALLGLSLVFGLVATGYRYLESREVREKLEENKKAGEGNVVNLEEYKQAIERKKQQLLELKRALLGFQNDGYKIQIPVSLDFPEKDPPKETFGEKLLSFGSGVRNHPLINAWDWQMTGIFFSRIVIPTVSVAIFWSVTSIAVLASLSNPISLALVFTLGTLYTVAKWYEKKHKKAEQELLDLPKESANLDSQIELAKLAHNYNKKKHDDFIAAKEAQEKDSQDMVDYSFLQKSPSGSSPPPSPPTNETSPALVVG